MVSSVAISHDTFVNVAGKCTGWRGGPQLRLRACCRSPQICWIRQPFALALQGVGPADVFITTWLRQATEAENIRVNAAMVRNLLDALSPAGSVRHVALVTGLKHYLGPFEAYGKGKLPETPFREELPRLDLENFYYAQEDEVFAAAEREAFGWSVHRPHTIIGYALGNAMNMGVTLAVYATICRETGRPFLLPGLCGAMERPDRHDRCPAARPASGMGRDDAGRPQSGVQCRQRRHLPLELDVAAAGRLVRDRTRALSRRRHCRWSPSWRTRVRSGPRSRRKHRLVETGPLGKLASAWHTDADLGRPIEVVTDMTKSRKLGFLDYQATDDSFFDLFARLREARIIP